MSERPGIVVPLRQRPSPQRRPPAPGSEAEVYSFTGAPIEPPDPQPVPAAARAAAALDFVRRRVSGEYEVDEYGFDADLTDAVTLPALRALYERWFRVEVNGIENVPTQGGALLVANHAGGLMAWDAAMTAVAVRVEHPARRRLRLLGGELVFRTPLLGTLARRTGATLACPADAERLLRAGELVGAWPEGARGIGKRWRDRYQVQRFASAAFVPAAIAAGVPIVPVSIVGAEETHPVLGHVKALDRLLDLPYVPVTPTFPWLGPLGLVPLPSKWYLEFGAPIDPAGRTGDAVGELVDHLHDTIQATLYRLLVQRRSTWR